MQTFISHRALPPDTSISAVMLLRQAILGLHASMNNMVKKEIKLC
jgi:hypothetical protein